MPQLPKNPDVIKAALALSDLNRAYHRALVNNVNPAYVIDAQQAYAKAQAILRDPAVDSLVRAAIDRLTPTGGLTPERGSGYLSQIDVSREDGRDLEWALAKHLGFSWNEYARYVGFARRQVSSLRRNNSLLPIHDTSVLVGVLAAGYDAFVAEIEALRLRSTKTSRRDRPRVVGGRRRRAGEQVFGTLFAVGIVVTNSEYGNRDFAKSYFLGSGVSSRLT